MPTALSKWCSLGIVSIVLAVVACASTIRCKREKMLNGYRCRRTNTAAGVVNNSIKVAKRHGYGIRMFTAFMHCIPPVLRIGSTRITRLNIRNVAEKDIHAMAVRELRETVKGLPEWRLVVMTLGFDGSGSIDASEATVGIDMITVVATIALADG